MSFSPLDELVYSGNNQFSIVKIDETIARSKRIVQESLAISNNTYQKLNNSKEQDYNSYEIDDSLILDFEVLKKNQDTSMFIDNTFEKETSLQNFKNLQNMFEINLAERQKRLQQLVINDEHRIKQIKQLENILNTEYNQKLFELEQKFKKKKDKIKVLSDAITSHSLYKENQDLKEKIKVYEKSDIEKTLKTSILEAKDQKENLEAQYNYLYRAHQESSKDTIKQLKELKDQIDQTKTDNKIKLNYLGTKLEEKILDNQLILDQIKLSSNNLSEINQKAETPTNNLPSTNTLSANNLTTDKKTRRCSNSDIEKEFHEYSKKINMLENELHKAKKKYQHLKNLYAKKSKKNSIDMKKIPVAAEKNKKKSLPKRKMSTKNVNKCLSCGRKNMTPRATPI
jgi:hypothetical protein